MKWKVHYTDKDRLSPRYNKWLFCPHAHVKGAAENRPWFLTKKNALRPWSTDHLSLQSHSSDCITRTIAICMPTEYINTFLWQVTFFASQFHSRNRGRLMNQMCPQDTLHTCCILSVFVCSHGNITCILKLIFALFPCITSANSVAKRDMKKFRHSLIFLSVNRRKQWPFNLGKIKGLSQGEDVSRQYGYNTF